MIHHRYRRFILGALMAMGVAVATIPSTAAAQTAGDPAGRYAADAPVTTTERGHSFGWIGLIGLIGLAGLMRRPNRDDRDDTVTTRPVR